MTDIQNATINMDKDVSIHIENRKKSIKFFWFIWVLYVLVYMTKNAFNGALASIVAEGVMTKSETGFITGMFYLVYAPFQIVGGIAVDRYSPELLIKIGLIGGAVSNIIIFCFPENYYVMLITWIFNAVIQFGIWPGIFKIITSQLARSDRGKMTYYISFSSTGGMIAAYLLAAMVTKWQYNFLVSSIVLVVLAFALHIYEKRLNPYMIRDKIDFDNVKLQKENMIVGHSTFKLFMAGGLIAILINVLFSSVESQSRQTLMPTMFVDIYNLTPEKANIINAFVIVFGVLGVLIAGKVLKKATNEIKVILVATLIMLPFSLVCIFAGKAPIISIIVSMCVQAALCSVVGLYRSYYTAQYTKYGISGTAAGIINSVSAVSFMVAAYVMPLIADTFGWDALIKIWPMLIGISAFSMALILKKYKKFKDGNID